MEMSRSLLFVLKKAVMSLVTDSMDVFGLKGSLFFQAHVLSLFRQRFKNVNITSSASVRKHNSLISSIWIKPRNSQTGLVMVSLLLSSVVNFSMGNLPNPQHGCW